MDVTVEMYSRLNAGAIEVETPTHKPTMVFLAGPIKYWWSEGMWDSPEHREYIKWRDAVEFYLVKFGALVYAPHRAWRGRWWETAQNVNNEAILQSDWLYDLTPPGIPAEGTAAEVAFAAAHNVEVRRVPPNDPYFLRWELKDSVDTLFERE